jgi:hypothetical protein
VDTGILARIIQEIQSDESKFAFQATFQNLLAALSQQTQATIETEQSTLRANLDQSILSGYVKTDYEALKALGVEEYFGLGSYIKLESILSLIPLAAQEALTAYVADRQAAISNVEAMRSTLSSFNLQPRTLAADEYEIGFSFPEQYKDIDKLYKALSDINKFLNELSSTKKHSPVKIAYVSNGSIDIFLHAGAELAKDFDFVAAHIVNICGFYHIAKESYKQFQRFAAPGRKTIKAEIDKQLKADVEGSVDELMKLLDIKDQVDRDRVRKLFVVLTEHISEGVYAEVRAPALPPLAEPVADAPTAEKKVFELKKLEYQTKLNIDKTNKDIYLLEKEDLKGSTKLLSDKLDLDDTDENKTP